MQYCKKVQLKQEEKGTCCFCKQYILGRKYIALDFPPFLLLLHLLK